MPILAKFCAVTCYKNPNWSEFVRHEARTKRPQLLKSHRVHCSYELCPLRHRNEPISSVTCAPVSWPVSELSRNTGPMRASDGACPASPTRNISHSVCPPLEKTVAGILAEPRKAWLCLTQRRCRRITLCKWTNGLSKSPTALCVSQPKLFSTAIPISHNIQITVHLQDLLLSCKLALRWLSDTVMEIKEFSKSL